MLCTASVRTIEAMIKRGELNEADLEDDRKEQVELNDDDFLDGLLNAYDDVALDPSREATIFSAEGTVLHTIRANCLVFDDEPYDYIGRTMEADGFKFVIDDDMAERLVIGIDWVRSAVPNIEVEQRVSLNEWLPGQHGFCDGYGLEDNTLFITDYKNGVGEPVSVFNSRQLRLYALGAWVALGKPDVKKIVLNIDQPRAGGMKFWEITLDELLEFGEEVRRVYQRIETGNVEFAPNSKSCRWCPIRKTKRGCAAYNQWHQMMLGSAMLDIGEDGPRLKDPAQMPRALRFYIVTHAASIKAWLVKLHEESVAAGMAGDPDPGSKVIEGNGRRYFTNPDNARAILIDALGEAAFQPEKLIGFTEIDKLMKPGRKKKGFPKQWDTLLKLVDLTEGKPKLVPADHPAPAFKKLDDDDFDDLL